MVVTADSVFEGAEFPRKVAGIDLSLTSTGISAVDLSNGEMKLTRICSTGKKTDTLVQQIERHNELSRRIVDSVLEHTPELVGIEGMRFGSRQDSSAMRRAGVWWQVVNALYAHGIPIVEVPPTTVKKWATGKGNAGKDMVMIAAAKRWDQVTQNDEADAAWIGDLVCYLKEADFINRTKARDLIVKAIQLP